MGFSKTLKGSEDVLRGAGIFPRGQGPGRCRGQEILEGMEIDARIDTKDVTLIKKRLASAKLTLAEVLTAANKRAVAAAVRRQANATAASLEGQVAFFEEELRRHFRTDCEKFSDGDGELRQRTGILHVERNILFGDDRGDLASIKPATPAFRIAVARKVLVDFASGWLGEMDR